MCVTLPAATVTRCADMPKKKPAVHKSASPDATGVIDWTGVRTSRTRCAADETIFAQGDPATSIMYVEDGAVRLTVLSHAGKEAVIAVLDAGSFFGEGALVGQSQRMATASAMMPTTIVVVRKLEMVRQLHARPAFADHFLRHMLARNIRIEEDLIDQLFNSSEKRLARALLLLARYGKQTKPRQVVATISQETLSEMIGTTRSRVNFFMNKFKKLGFIEYDGDLDKGIQINSSLLSVVLHD